MIRQNTDTRKMEVIMEGKHLLRSLSGLTVTATAAIADAPHRFFEQSPEGYRVAEA
jgi:hypothetical protein